MNLDAIRDSLPDYARDLKLNLGAVLAPTGALHGLMRVRGFVQDDGTVARLAPERALSFFHTHTNERLSTAYCAAGEYMAPALADVNHLLRDFRVNQVKPIDPNLLDLLFELNDKLGTDQPFHVISGYRTPQTNSMLQERGGSHSGVATHSLHMDGKAIDVRIPGQDLAKLHRVAMAQKSGGVGYYPDSQFVHMDVGRVRYW